MRKLLAHKLADSLRRVAQTIAPSSPAGSEDYVRMAYLVLLRRPIDPAGLYTWREYIASGTFDQQYVITAMLQSEEYQSRFGVDVLGLIHRARQQWIKTVPAFARILDIGGSSRNEPAGALIELGYPYRPRELDILDLPPDKQYWGKPTYDQNVSREFDWGTVSYFHGSGEGVADVDALQERVYDGIYLGQAIEHIRPEALPGMLDWVRRHLSPGGKLVFDTPNRLLTKIQCPDSLIDPDHKYEYTPAEMDRVMSAAGFEVVKKTGMVYLPNQAASGRYDPLEFVDAPALSDDVDACYLFAFEATVN